MAEAAPKPRLAATPAGVRLCSFAVIADGAARTFVFEQQDGLFVGFVVRQGAEVRGYVDRCPHAGLPLAHELDGYMTPKGDYIMCGWHGALFEPLSGACVGGPCMGRSLTPWPVMVKNGSIWTA